MAMLKQLKNATRVGSVYKITNEITGKCYIGSSFNVDVRVKNHFVPSASRLSSGHTSLYDDMNKFGRSNFSAEVLEDFTTRDIEADRGKLIEMEVKWTLHFNSHIDGYNWSLGDAVPEHRHGQGHHRTGTKHSPEALEKIRQTSIGRKQSPETIEKRIAPLRGVSLSEEHRRKIAEAQRGENSYMWGKTIPLETVRKIAKSVALAKGGEVLDEVLPPETVAQPVKKGTPKVPKGRDPSNPKSRDTAGEKNAFYGKKHSPESIEKQRQAKLNLPPEVKEARRKAHSERMKGMNAGSANVRARAVRCVETGFVYGSITEAGVAIGAGKKNNISKALKEGCTCGGYHWEYADSPKTLG